MNQLINITEQDGTQAVSARELHGFLEVNTPFKKWVDRMIESYGFEENVDYLLVVQKCPTNNPKNPWTEITEYAISLDMAKELSMVQRTEKGKQARQYFIECEKKLRDTLMPPSYLIADEIERAKAWIVEKEQMRALENEAKELTYALIEAKPKVTYYDIILRSSDLMTIKLIAQDYGISANKLNNILHENKIQYKDGNTWYLYADYKGHGYVQTQTYPYTRPDGTKGSKTHMSWTQKGRLLIHELLIKLGYDVDASKFM